MEDSLIHSLENNYEISVSDEFHYKEIIYFITDKLASAENRIKQRMLILFPETKTVLKNNQTR